LEQFCVVWEAEKEQSEIPPEIEEKILLATGMARLLIREKFNQFRGLIENCDHPEDPKTKTLLSDLQGFWDMIKIQADKIGTMFEALEKLKKNDWQEELEVQKPKAAAKRKAAPKPAKPVVASRFKAFLAQKKGTALNDTFEVEKKTPIAKKATPKRKSS
jgi:hypothetical protein